MALPQRINYITLGAQDMSGLRAFYAAMGWRERPGSNNDFATYEAGGSLLALYPLGRLGEEAAPDEEPPAAQSWNGVTLGVNLESPQDVDHAFELCVASGAKVIAEPTKREWGGYSGYLADPEGHRWEITWAPAG